ncbi:fasciclin domain-containing protein [Dyadobacter arcticus]|uniref:Surface protein with fasciclin (FAS1) repeats n=1 Tax=Dyadobacter arcticus TaxID=1078754 RepID=A0ABX0UED7_9BACT|nr:fasciclin domain-containing protein [Dyadobacter arcticus]NIJ51347.1 putative surface protein with fasciclin (FAS1) repeats [Dyadobacter arcticus]
MKKNRFVGRFATFFLTVALLSSAVYSCKEKNEDIVKPITITDIILQNEQFSMLRDIMLYAGMSDAMRTENYTLFAPNNNAFGKANIFNSSAITSLPKDSARLFIQNHIVKKSFPYIDLKVGNQESVNRKKLTITKVDSLININKSEILIKDVKAANGLIHVIDSLLVR